MPLLLWDASALVKRYVREVGSETVEALFAALPMSQAVTTLWTYVETFAILLRRHNGGVISAEAFAIAASALETDIMFSGEPVVLSIEDRALHDSLLLIRRHNLNSVDAALLMTFQRFAAQNETRCILVTADRRLARAAQAEGLIVLNPETAPAHEVPTFLAGIELEAA
jgi:predicted nucleic acid-binding protein